MVTSHKQQTFGNRYHNDLVIMIVTSYKHQTFGHGCHDDLVILMVTSYKHQTLGTDATNTGHIPFKCQ
jgi:hypothetical protein